MKHSYDSSGSFDPQDYLLLGVSASRALWMLITTRTQTWGQILLYYLQTHPSSIHTTTDGSRKAQVSVTKLAQDPGGRRMNWAYDSERNHPGPTGSFLAITPLRGFVLLQLVKPSRAQKPHLTATTVSTVHTASCHPEPGPSTSIPFFWPLLPFHGSSPCQLPRHMGSHSQPRGASQTVPSKGSFLHRKVSAAGMASGWVTEPTGNLTPSPINSPSSKQSAQSSPCNI